LDAKPAVATCLSVGTDIAAIADHATQQQTSPNVGSLLPIDGSPQWIWLGEKDVELLADERT
jgi:hypothetical protein